MMIKNEIKNDDINKESQNENKKKEEDNENNSNINGNKIKDHKDENDKEKLKKEEEEDEIVENNTLSNAYSKEIKNYLGVVNNDTIFEY